MPEFEFYARTNKLNSECSVTEEIPEEELPDDPEARGEYIWEVARDATIDLYEIGWREK